MSVHHYEAKKVQIDGVWFMLCQSLDEPGVAVKWKCADQGDTPIKPEEASAMFANVKSTLAAKAATTRNRRRNGTASATPRFFD